MTLINKKTIPILVIILIGAGLFLTQNNKTFSTASNDFEGNIQTTSSNNLFSFLAQGDECTPSTGYNTCYITAYQDYGLVATAEVNINNIGTTATENQELEYECTAGDKARLIGERDPSNIISDWESLTFNTGEAIELKGSIPVTHEKLQKEFSIVCADKTEGSDGSWVATWVSYSQNGFTVEEAEPSITEYLSPDVSTNEDQISTTVYLENTGSSMQENYLVELAPEKTSSLSFLGNLAFVGNQETCEDPENVHKDFRLDSGEKTSFTLTSSGLDRGDYDVKLVSTNGCSSEQSNVVKTGPYGWGSVVDSVSVEGVNRDPVIESTQPDEEAVVGEVFTVSVLAEDPDGDSLNYEWTGGQTGNTANYVWDSPGTRTVEVTITDGNGGSVSESFTVDVQEANQKPVVNSLNVPDTVEVDTGVTASVDASDPDGDELSYTWSNGETGESVLYSFSETGEQSIGVTVSDGEAEVFEETTVNVVEESGLWERIVNWFNNLF